jgi:hypothetical protein
MSLIGKIEAEKILEEKNPLGSGAESIRFRRYLTVSLSGYVDRTVILLSVQGNFLNWKTKHL